MNKIGQIREGKKSEVHQCSLVSLQCCENSLDQPNKNGAVVVLGVDENWNKRGIIVLGPEVFNRGREPLNVEFRCQGRSRGVGIPERIMNK